MNPPFRLGLLALNALLFACSPSGENGATGDAAPETPSRSVELSAEVVPRGDGSADVIASLTTNGVPIVPAGDTTSGTGHHHLYLNADLTPADQPVPSVPGSIVHMGDASARYTFEAVPAGEHRMIAVVADGVHVPLQPWVVDTVTFTVGEAGAGN